MLKGNKKSNFVPIDISGNIFQKTHFPPPPFLLYLSVNNVKCHLEYISPEVIIFNLFTKTKPEEKTLWYFFCSAHLGSNDSHNKPSRCFHPDPINWYWIIWAAHFRVYFFEQSKVQCNTHIIVRLTGINLLRLLVNVKKQDNKQYVVIIYFSKFDEDQSTLILDMISLK